MIDHRDRLPVEIENQGDLGKCVGVGCKVLADFYGYEIPSRLIYEKAKVLDEIAGEDYSGTTLLGGVKAIEELSGGRLVGRRVQFGEFLDILKDVPIGVVIPTKLIDVSRTGKHMMVACAYDGERVLLRNGWGAIWGNGGYLWIEKEKLFGEAYDECWTVMTKVDRAKERAKKMLPFLIGGGLLAALLVWLLVL